jgi:hypothetical protein
MISLSLSLSLIYIYIYIYIYILCCVLQIGVEMSPLWHDLVISHACDIQLKPLGVVVW